MSIDLQDTLTAEPPSCTMASFVIGRDAEGHWLAVETHGLSGGLFTSQEAALRYATFETDHRAGAVLLASEPVALRL
jgi:hypothetical protein